MSIRTAFDIGSAVRKRRKEAGLTVAAAAKKCQVSIQFYHDLEKGKGTIQFNKAIAAAEVMGVTLDLVVSRGPTPADKARFPTLNQLVEENRRLGVLRGRRRG